MAMISDSGGPMAAVELEEFLTTGAIFAKIATALPDGWPVVSPVWYEWEAGERAFLIVSKARTSIVQNLRRDPRCGVLVDNTAVPYKRVSVQGTAEFLGEGFDWVTPARRMALRYLGPEGLSYAEATFHFPRVPFRIKVDKMSTWNGAGFDRTFTAETVWHETP